MDDISHIDIYCDDGFSYVGVNRVVIRMTRTDGSSDNISAYMAGLFVIWERHNWPEDMYDVHTQYDGVQECLLTYGCESYAMEDFADSAWELLDRPTYKVRAFDAGELVFEEN